MINKARFEGRSAVLGMDSPVSSWLLKSAGDGCHSVQAAGPESQRQADSGAFCAPLKNFQEPALLGHDV